MKKFIPFIAIFGLIFCQVAQADVGTSRAYDYFNLTGGLNDTADPVTLSPNEAADLQNVIFSNAGGIERRGGFSRINSSAIGSTAVGTGLTFYRQSDADRFLVSLVSSGVTDKLYKMDYGAGTTGPDGTWDDVSSSLSLSFSDNELGDFAPFQDTLYIAYGDGTRSLLKYTGSGDATELTSLPDAAMVEAHKRILWVAGRSDARSQLNFSNLDVPETFTATDSIAVETNDNQVITGIKSALDCLYVFKTESIWRVCGSDRDNFNLEQMVRGVGASGNQTIALINNQFVFLTNQGNIVVYDGGITIQLLSSKIQGTLSTLNLERLPQAVGLAFDDGTGDEDYYLCLSRQGEGTNQLMLVYDTLFKAWTKFTGIACNALTVYETGTRQRALAFFDYAGRANLYPDTEADAGATIASFYRSGHLRLDVPQQKTFQQIQAIFQQRENERVTLNYYIDFGTTTSGYSISLAGTGAIWDTAVWDTAVYADVATIISRNPIGHTGDFIQWDITDTDDHGWRMRGVRLWAEPTGRLGGE